MRKIVVMFLLAGFTGTATAVELPRDEADAEFGAAFGVGYAFTFGGARAPAAPHRLALTLQNTARPGRVLSFAESRFGPRGVQRLSLGGVSLLAPDYVLAQTGGPMPIGPQAQDAPPAGPQTTPMEDPPTMQDPGQPPTQGPSPGTEIETLPFPSQPPKRKPKSYFGKLTGIQWLGIGVTLAAVAAVAASDSGGADEPAPTASGGS